MHRGLFHTHEGDTVPRHIKVTRWQQMAVRGARAVHRARGAVKCCAARRPDAETVYGVGIWAANAAGLAVCAAIAVTGV